LPAEEKMYQWFTDTSTFNLKANFNINQLAYAQTDHFNKHRDHFFPSEEVSKTDIMRARDMARPWHQTHLNLIDEMVQNNEKQFDTPFDQIYHKERKLVQDIVKAEKSLKAIQDQLPNPAGNRIYDIT